MTTQRRKGPNGGDLAAAALRALGVEQVFLIASEHNLPMVEAFDRAGMELVLFRHEQNAVHAADAFSRCSGKLGVALASTGPGTANSMGGLLEASMASSRVLLLTAQVPSHLIGQGKGALHEADAQTAMLRTVARRVETVRRPGDIGDVIMSVAHDILSGRPQPGAVEIPIDYQYASVGPLPEFRLPAIALDMPSLEEIMEVGDVLAGTERLLMWGGGGVVRAGASEAFTRLAERLQAPVLTTAGGRGAISEDHPLSMGTSPDLPEVAALIESAEYILVVGSTLDYRAVRHWNTQLPLLLQIDVDPAAIGRHFPVEMAMVGDAKATCEALFARIEEMVVDVPPPRKWFRDEALEVRAQAEARLREECGPDHAAILDLFTAQLPSGAVVVKDSTVPAYAWGERLLPVREPGTSLRSVSRAIGVGLPFGLGAAMASGAPVVVIAGDGGAMTSIQELIVAVQHAMPVILCVFNDGGYGILRTRMNATLGRAVGVDLETPDFVKLAEAVGAAGEKITSPEQAGDALARALKASGPTVLEFDMAALAPITFVLP